MKITQVKLFTDGGARGNPGPAGVGAVITDMDGKVIATKKKFLGVATNNQAEYQALLLGLETAKKIGAREVACYLDSELTVKQMRREYKVKNPELAKLFVKVWNLLPDFEKVTFHHVMREKNVLADQLANEAMDEGMGR